MQHGNKGRPAMEPCHGDSWSALLVTQVLLRLRFMAGRLRFMWCLLLHLMSWQFLACLYLAQVLHLWFEPHMRPMKIRPSPRCGWTPGATRRTEARSARHSHTQVCRALSPT